MAVDAIAVNVIVAFVIGALRGAFSFTLGWLKANEEFNTKKAIAGLATGIIAGVALVLGVIPQVQAATDAVGLIVVYVGIILAIVGVDTLRTSISGAVVTRNDEQQAQEAQPS